MEKVKSFLTQAFEIKYRTESPFTTVSHRADISTYDRHLPAQRAALCVHHYYTTLFDFVNWE